MAVFDHGLNHGDDAYEPGQYVRHTEARPDNGLDPIVEIVEDLGTIESPCGEADCRGDCLEYMVRAARNRPRKGGRYGKDYNLAECEIEPLVNIL